MAKKAITFGEIMLRLAPEGYYRFCQAGVNALRRYGVDTSMITRGSDRVGICFLEKGAGQRPSKVICDRAGSAIATATTADFNWDEIFQGADWFHFTGITPALGDNVTEICTEARKAADTDVTTCKVTHEGSKDVAKQPADRFGMSKIAITLRGSISANNTNSDIVHRTKRNKTFPMESLFLFVLISITVF